MNKSISTVKADAAHISFSALGSGIVWAVMDSGVDGRHPHFALHGNLDIGPDLKHRNFTDDGTNPLEDASGHGTHVAGIIAGELQNSESENKRIRAIRRYRDEHDTPRLEEDAAVNRLTGMAPHCKVMSLKVLDEKGSGFTRNLIEAIQYVQEMNGYGRRLKVHGVNMSVGYEFEPEWFACGQSPLCVEVDHLVRSGVVVVVAAGNTGYGWQQLPGQQVRSAGLDLTINDPGNAERAITVGSTHRDMPHIYGVSYFSSKGPTGDGRPKPDLIAPGEKILSCGAGKMLEKVNSAAGDPVYVEDSGTSQAAPHVSGVIASFLSVRKEFIGRCDEVKTIFSSTATDLKRDKSFQGHGLVDLMRAIQSV
jgi:serine protease AprX